MGVEQRPQKEKIDVQYCMQMNCIGEVQSARVVKPKDRIAFPERLYVIFLLLGLSRSGRNVYRTCPRCLCRVLIQEQQFWRHLSEKSAEYRTAKTPRSHSGRRDDVP